MSGVMVESDVISWDETVVLVGGCMLDGCMLDSGMDGAAAGESKRLSIELVGAVICRVRRIGAGCETG